MTDSTIQSYRVCIPRAPMKATPHQDAVCTNECLYGEWVDSDATPSDASTGAAFSTTDEPIEKATIEGINPQWLQVAAQRDGYSGFMHSSHLQKLPAQPPATTHWVCSRSTLVFSQASIKSRVITRLPFMSRVTSKAVVDERFHQLDTGGFLWHQHLLKCGEYINVSAIELAQSHFLGAPYLWGGCSPDGLDCSGLVQALALAKGIRIPRDSGDQEQALTNDIDVGKQRSQDVVYWPGHTGILLDANTLLHATAHFLDCVVEPLDNVIDRAGDITSIKRIFS